MPYRGKLNEPKYIKNIAIFASHLLNMDLNVFENKIYKNSLKIFHVERNEDKN